MTNIMSFESIDNALDEDTLINDKTTNPNKLTNAVSDNAVMSWHDIHTHKVHFTGKQDIFLSQCFEHLGFLLFIYNLIFKNFG